MSTYAGNGTAASSSYSVPLSFATFNAPSRWLFSPVSGAAFVLDSGGCSVRRLALGPAPQSPSPSPTLLPGWSPSATPTPSAPTTPTATPAPSSDAAAAAQVCTIKLVAGSGSAGSAAGIGAAASVNNPYALSVDATTGDVWFSDISNYLIRAVTPAGAVVRVAGSSPPGFADGQGSNALFSWCFSIATTVGGAANPLGAGAVVGDGANSGTSSYRLRFVTPSGLVTTLAGNGVQGFADGAASSAMFSSSFSGVATDPAGNIFVADT